MGRFPSSGASIAIAVYQLAIGKNKQEKWHKTVIVFIYIHCKVHTHTFWHGASYILQFTLYKSACKMCVCKQRRYVLSVQESEYGSSGSVNELCLCPALAGGGVHVV